MSPGSTSISSPLDFWLTLVRLYSSDPTTFCVPVFSAGQDPVYQTLQLFLALFFPENKVLLKLCAPNQPAGSSCMKGLLDHAEAINDGTQ